MNLTIDIGNTRTKIALFNGETFVREEKFENTDAEHLLNVVKEKEAEGLAFCSVAAENPLLVEALKQLPYPVLEVKGTTPAPVTVAYRTPETLGADRLAAVVGAVTLKPQTDLLVVDAGTCITYDFVDAAGNYLGGNISPGVEMRLEALHNCTARLPLAKKAPRLTHFPHRRRPLHFQRCTAKKHPDRQPSCGTRIKQALAKLYALTPAPKLELYIHTNSGIQKQNRKSDFPFQTLF